MKSMADTKFDLLFATRGGNFQLVHNLVTDGADLDMAADWLESGRTALLIASSIGFAKTAEILIKGEEFLYYTKSLYPMPDVLFLLKGLYFTLLNKHCRARPCKRPPPYDPDFGLSMSHRFGKCHKQVWVPTQDFMAPLDDRES